MIEPWRILASAVVLVVGGFLFIYLEVKLHPTNPL